MLPIFGSISALADNPSQPLSVLIVHDQPDDPQLAQGLSLLLGHFPVRSDVVAQDDYISGAVNSHDAVFYLGASSSPIPQAFLDDAYASGNPVVWMGRGLDQLGRNHPLSKYGIGYQHFDSSGSMNIVTYKDMTLTKTNPDTTFTYVTDNNKAVTVASMEGALTLARDPYEIKSGNFWFFADIPMIGMGPDGAYSAVGATEDSAFLVLADQLHDILSQDHPTAHDALVRIEDIHPNSDPGQLQKVIDYLYHEGVPFGIGLVPVYVNPATDTRVPLSERPEMVKVLKDAQAKGGVIVMHGYTHQRVGETVVDYEFWDGETNAPPRDENAASITTRLDAGLAELAKVGIHPQIWESPHYAASELTLDMVATRFSTIWERHLTPFFPYQVRRNDTDTVILPETLGYINPEEGKTADHIIAVADKQKVVRDGVAAFFFHPYIGTGELRQVVEGLRIEGYTFVSPAAAAGLPDEPPPAPGWFDNLVWQVDNVVDAVLPGKMLGLFLAAISFFTVIYYWGLFTLSIKVPPLRSAAFNPRLAFVIVIPALNEELVIGKTLDHLLSLPQENLHILVVDDNSDDRTAEIARSYPSDRVTVMEHPRTQARQGKGRVLCYAFSRLMAGRLIREKGAENVILGVLDADGRVEPHIIEAVNPYFSEPRSGAVQVGVRIFNADANALTMWQNYEFIAFARIAQKAREHIGSVGLGGNGQFTRMSALASLGSEPWSDCLTEDLDLGIRLFLKGWRNHYCPDTFVAQQGLTRLRPLLRQRTAGIRDTSAAGGMFFRC